MKCEYYDGTQCLYYLDGECRKGRCFVYRLLKRNERYRRLCCEYIESHNSYADKIGKIYNFAKDMENNNVMLSGSTISNILFGIINS